MDSGTNRETALLASCLGMQVSGARTRGEWEDHLQRFVDLPMPRPTSALRISIHVDYKGATRWDREGRVDHLSFPGAYGQNVQLAVLGFDRLPAVEWLQRGFLGSGLVPGTVWEMEALVEVEERLHLPRPFTLVGAGSVFFQGGGSLPFFLVDEDGAPVDGIGLIESDIPRSYADCYFLYRELEWRLSNMSRRCDLLRDLPLPTASHVRS